MPDCAAEIETDLIHAEEIPNRKAIWQDIFRLSWPAAVELFLTSMISMITMAMVSSLGKEAVSAVGVTNQPLMLPNVLLQAFCVGGTALVARSLGMRERAQAKQASEQTMLLSIIFSVFCTVIMYLFGSDFIRWMGATPDYYDMSVLYMRYCAIGVFFQSITTSVAALLRGEGRTRLSMYFSVIANIANILIGYVLIYGLGPFPELGILGAAIAQLVAKVIGFVVALWVLLRPSDLAVRPNMRQIFTPHKPTILRICRVGTSTALEQVALRVGIILFTIFVIRLGTAEYAAHNIASSIHSYVVNFGQALSIALVSQVGQNLGAGRPEVASRYFSESIKMSSVISVVMMIPLLLIPESIASLFSTEADVIDNVATALRILAAFVAPQIIQIAVCGGLRGGGDTTWPLISTLAGVLGMRMVFGYLFIVVLEWGLAGAWFCWFLDQTIRAVIIYFRYRSGKWKTVQV